MSEFHNIYNYPPPMELEEEEHSGSARFLSTHITLKPGGPLKSQYYHKNTFLAHDGKQPLKNVVPFDSHVPKHQHFGRVVGALHRANTATRDLTSQHKARELVLHEFEQFGMSQNLQEQACAHFYDFKRTGTYRHRCGL